MRGFYEDIHDVIRNSAAPCYVYYGERRFYPELHENIRKLNTVLGSFRRGRIALYAEKSFETYCGVFGIFLSGNTWVPVSPSHPVRRNLDILSLAAPSLILTDRPLPPEIQAFAVERGIRVADMFDTLNGNARCEIEPADFDGDDIAYIMFTSGSTGIPKGVPMTHRNYINFVKNALEILRFGKNEVFSDFHDLGFDISIFYLFCCILTESAFAPVLKEQERFCPLDNIIKNKVTVWSSVPSVISRIMMLRPHEKIHTDISIMFLCGEPFRLDVLEYCYKNLGLERVYNFYGLTETGVENFHHACEPGDLERFRKQGFVPIGRPMKGNDIMVTDSKELLLGGCQITPGYLGGVGQERFETIDGVKWFHSGDIVEKFEDVYFCKGRMDSQVKLSGYRVELMDIEAHVRRFKGISDSVCFVDDRRERSVLACALEAGETPDIDGLRRFLKQELPSYMIPGAFVVMESFPRNKNGKTDRKAIRERHQPNKEDLTTDYTDNTDGKVKPRMDADKRRQEQK